MIICSQHCDLCKNNSYRNYCAQKMDVIDDNKDGLNCDQFILLEKYRPIGV